MTPAQPADLPSAFAAAAAVAATGPVEAAIAAFEGVVARWPRVAVAHANLAVLRRRAGRLEAAIEAFRAAARLQPDEPERHADLAAACHAGGWMEDAVVALRRRAVLRPGDPDGAYNLGVTLPLMGSREDGRRWMGFAVRLDPSRWGGWDRLARAAAAAGDDRLAGIALRRAAALSPGSVDALKDLARFAEERSRYRRWLMVEPGSDEARMEVAAHALAAGDAAAAGAALAAFDGRPAVPDRAVRLAREAGMPAAQGWRSRYELWIDAYERPPATVSADNRDAPTIAILMPVCDPEPRFLEEAIASVEAQSWPHWQLCIADDASRDPAIRVVLEAARARDPRIRVTWRTGRGHISAASNDALGLATASHVGFLDHDDRLAPHALARVAAALIEDPALDLVYSDEDKIDAAGNRHDPHFKPDWDPDRVLVQNIVTHLAVFRRVMVEELGGLRVGLEGSQDHDLVLRVAERSTPVRIRHLPHVLYHWRAVDGSTALDPASKPYAAAAADRAAREHLGRTGAVGAYRREADGPRVVWPVPDPAPLVGLIVATRDRVELLRRCVEGVLHRTDYPALELVILDNGSERRETIGYLAGAAADPRVRVLARPGPFNFSALMNDGVGVARGTVLVFLNNDVEPLDPGWLSELVGQAVRPDVGAVGAKLLYPNRRVQHGGVTLAGDWVARHADVGLTDDHPGYLGRSRLAQTMSAVTGACLAMRRTVFDAVGGFDAAELAVDFSDIDLCLKAGAAGFRTVWTPHARLLHHESASRGPYLTAAKKARWEAEAAVMRARWGELLHHDPYYNANLAIDPETRPYELAFPPRSHN